MAKKTSTVLRHLLARDEILLRPTVATALHARMVEKAGFESMGISGAFTAAHVYGMPDAGLLTQTEMVDNVRRICNAVSIPVMADCDTGYGNAINVRRTIELVIQAGAAGCFIEDQLEPKRCGFVKGKQLIPIEEAVGKYKAAVDVRDELDEDFVIMARTDGRTAVGGSLEEAIRRGKAYREEAGVDIVYFEALQSREEIAAAAAAIDGMVACTCLAVQPPPTREELQELGMCVAMGIMFFMAGDLAMWDVLTGIRERGLEAWYEWGRSSIGHPMGGFGVFDLMGWPRVRELEELYLPRENLDKYGQSQGLYDPEAKLGKAPGTDEE